VDVLGVGVRFALYLDLMVMFGLAAFGLLSLRAAERAAVLPLRLAIVASGLLGAALSALGLAATAASMAGVPLSAIDRTSMVLLLTGTTAGAAWSIRMAALALVVLLSALASRRPGPGLSAAAAAGGVAVATLAWTGHGAMDEGAVGWLHLGADIAHLLAASVWFGALVGLSMLVMRRSDKVDAAHLTLSQRALDGFSTTGTVVVGVIVVTGLVNSWLLVGPNGLSMLSTSLYGRLLVAKVLMFVVMVGLASLNRFRLTPALGRALAGAGAVEAISALRRSLAVETACAVVVLAIVSWLGTLEPIASAM